MAGFKLRTNTILSATTSYSYNTKQYLPPENLSLKISDALTSNILIEEDTNSQLSIDYPNQNTKKVAKAIMFKNKTIL